MGRPRKEEPAVKTVQKPSAVARHIRHLREAGLDLVEYVPQQREFWEKLMTTGDFIDYMARKLCCDRHDAEIVVAWADRKAAERGELP